MEGLHMYETIRASIPLDHKRNIMFEIPCIISLYYIKNQRDATWQYVY